MSQARFGKQGVPRSEWDRPPWNRWSFQHVGEFLPTATISRGSGPFRRLARREVYLDDLPVTGLDGTAVSLISFLEQTFTDGFLVLHRGVIAFERYLNGMDSATLHLSQSLAKSMVGVLAGALAARHIVDLDVPVETYIPELMKTAYRGAHLQHLLDMTGGVRFSEDYTDPFSGMGRADVASGWKPIPAGGETSVVWPRTMRELILSLTESEAEHGARFAYRSIETDTLALVLESAAGVPLAQMLSDHIWQPLGMELDATITVDADGFALADGGLNACLRDYGRFGQMVLEGGAAVVPADWIKATRSGDHAMFGPPYTEVLPRGAYRNQFWIEDSVGSNLMARGVFGQLIYVGFEQQLVIVKLSSWPDFVNAHWTRATLAAVHRIGEALSPSA